MSEENERDYEARARTHAIQNAAGMDEVDLEAQRRRIGALEDWFAFCNGCGKRITGSIEALQAHAGACHAV